MIKVIAVGKMKKSYLSEAVQYYLKQLNKTELFEVKDEKDKSGIKIEEKAIIERIKTEDFVILLAIEGTMIDSEQLAHKIDTIQTNMQRDIVFIIGGSYGVGPEIYKRANEMISISRMTFPHQLVRVMLVEQIYRAQMILKHHPYHK